MKKIKLIHLVFLFWLVILIARMDLLYNVLNFVSFIFSGSVEIRKIDLGFFDYVFSTIVFFLFPLAVWKLRNRLNQQINWAGVSITVFLFVILFTPLISTSNPALHHDIKRCKLLHPFSVVAIENQENYQTAQAAVDLQKYFYKIINRGIDKKTVYLKSNNKGDDKILFIFGTDEYGRDVFSRILYGTRFAFFLGLSSVIVSFLLAFILGAIAGFGGKFWDNLLNRFTEIFLSFPFLFLIIVFLAFFGNSFWVVVLVLGFSGWMGLFKIIRAEILKLKSKDFIISARMLGMPNHKILLKEIFPIIFAPVVVNLILQFGNVIMAESALSFLGFSVGDEYFSWGAMINSGQYYLADAWWLSFFPSLFLALTLIMMNKFGNELEKIYNPGSTK